MLKNSQKLLLEILLLLFIATAGLTLGFISALKFVAPTHANSQNYSSSTPAPPPLAENTTTLSGVISSQTANSITLENNALQINYTPDTIFVKISATTAPQITNYETSITAAELKLKDMVSIETTESITGENTATAKKIILLTN